jgi:hypothetical protein
LKLVPKADLKALFILCLLSMYGLGAGLVESLVNYPSWLLIGPAEFREYHAFLAWRISFVLVAPLLAQQLLSLWIYWKYPVQRQAMMLQLLLQSVFWGSSLFWQIPIQGKLGVDGKDWALIEELVYSDLALRSLPHLLQTAHLVYVCFRKLFPASARPELSA